MAPTRREVLGRMAVMASAVALAPAAAVVKAASATSGGYPDLDVGELRVHTRTVHLVGRNGYNEEQWANKDDINPATGKPRVFAQIAPHICDIAGVPHYHFTIYTPEATEPNGRKHHWGIAWPISGKGPTRIFTDSADTVDEKNMKGQIPRHYVIGDDGNYYRTGVDRAGKPYAIRENPPGGFGAT